MPEKTRPTTWRGLEPRKRYLIIAIIIAAMLLGLGLGFAPPHIQAVVNPIIMLSIYFFGTIKALLVGIGYYRAGRRVVGVLCLILALFLLLLGLVTLDGYL